MPQCAHGRTWRLVTIVTAPPALPSPTLHRPGTPQAGPRRPVARLNLSPPQRLGLFSGAVRPPALPRRDPGGRWPPASMPGGLMLVAYIH